MAYKRQGIRKLVFTVVAVLSAGVITWMVLILRATAYEQGKLWMELLVSSIIVGIVAFLVLLGVWAHRKKSKKTKASELTRPMLALGTALGVMLPLTGVLWTVQAGQVSDRESLIESEYQQATQNLGSDQAIVRMTSLKRLADLADSLISGDIGTPAGRIDVLARSCIDSVTSYLRTPIGRSSDLLATTSDSGETTWTNITGQRVDSDSLNFYDPTEVSIRETTLNLLVDHLQDNTAPIVRDLWRSEVSDLSGSWLVNADFTRATFGPQINFADAHFIGWAIFDFVHFDYVTFDGARFSSGVSFGGTIFGKSAFFDYATFVGDAMFGSAYRQAGAAMNEEDMPTNGAQFLGYASFSFSTWLSDSIFGLQSKEYVSTPASFACGFSFANSVFHGTAYFEDITAGAEPGTTLWDSSPTPAPATNDCGLRVVFEEKNPVVPEGVYAIDYRDGVDLSQTNFLGGVYLALLSYLDVRSDSDFTNDLVGVSHISNWHDANVWIDQAGDAKVSLSAYFYGNSQYSWTCRDCGDTPPSSENSDHSSDVTQAISTLNSFAGKSAVVTDSIQLNPTLTIQDSCTVAGGSTPNYAVDVSDETCTTK